MNTDFKRYGVQGEPATIRLATQSVLCCANQTFQPFQGFICYSVTTVTSVTGLHLYKCYLFSLKHGPLSKRNKNKGLHGTTTSNLRDDLDLKYAVAAEFRLSDRLITRQESFSVG